MAKATIDTGVASQSVHTRTTADTAESQVAVIGIDGSDSVVGADVTNGLDVDVTRVTGTVTVDGSAVTQPVSNAGLTELAAAISTEVQCDIVGPLPAGTNNIGDVDVLSLPALAAGNKNVGDVDVLTIAAGDNNIGNVDVVTVPAGPFGANADATVAAGAVGSIQAKLRRLTSDLDAVKTAVETLDNAIAGTEMQVDVVAALPAGTNANGKLAANS